jgi:hypothetical protein
MVVVLSSHAVSNGFNCHHIMTESKCTKLKKYDHEHHELCRTNITSEDDKSNYSNMFPQYAPANQEISCLSEIGDFFFSEIAVVLRLPVSLACAQPKSREIAMYNVTCRKLQCHIAGIRLG